MGARKRAQNAWNANFCRETVMVWRDTSDRYAQYQISTKTLLRDVSHSYVDVHLVLFCSRDVTLGGSIHSLALPLYTGCSLHTIASTWALTFPSATWESNALVNSCTGVLEVTPYHRCNVTLTIESPRTGKRVSTGALEVPNDLSEVQTKIWKNGRVAVDNTSRLCCLLVWWDLPITRYTPGEVIQYHWNSLITGATAHTLPTRSFPACRTCLSKPVML